MSNKHEEIPSRKVLRTLKWSADYYWVIQGLGLRFSVRCTLCFMSSSPDKVILEDLKYLFLRLVCC